MSIVTAPQVHLWTRQEYQHMAALGWFTHQRVELVAGQVLDMSPLGSEHATAVVLVATALPRARVLILLSLFESVGARALGTWLHSQTGTSGRSAGSKNAHSRNCHHAPH